MERVSQMKLIVSIVITMTLLFILGTDLIGLNTVWETVLIVALIASLVWFAYLISRYLKHRKEQAPIEAFQRARNRYLLHVHPGVLQDLGNKKPLDEIIRTHDGGGLEEQVFVIRAMEFYRDRMPERYYGNAELRAVKGHFMKVWGVDPDALDMQLWDE